MAKSTKGNRFIKWLKQSPPSQVTALILAGPAITCVVVLIILLAVFAGWTDAQEALQLQILREAVAYSYVLLLIVIGALTAGLVRGFKVGVGKVSAELDLADDEDDKEVEARLSEVALERRRLDEESKRDDRRRRRWDTEPSCNDEPQDITQPNEFEAPDPEVTDGTR